MIVVPAQRTPMTESAAARALADSYADVMGRSLSKNAGELLLAQSWTETAQGKSCFNNNPGNMSASSKYGGKAWLPPWVAEPTAATSERNRFLHKEMLAGRAPSAFRAYDSLTDGMRDHVKLLHNTFPAILVAAETGDARTMADAIYSSRYCRDDACRGEKNVRNIEFFQSLFRRNGTFDFLGGAETVPLVLRPLCSQSDGPTAGPPCWLLEYMRSADMR